MQLETNERELVNNKLLRIDDYFGYDFISNAGNIKYSICGYYEVVGYDSNGSWILKSNPSQEYFIGKIIEQSGELPLDMTIVNQWGASDQLIFDYVASQLNVTLV